MDNPINETEVREVLFRGFLCSVVEVQFDQTVLNMVFKTLSAAESDLIRLQTASKQKTKSGYLAPALTFCYSVFMVDGQNVLEDRSKFFPELYQTFMKLPSDVTNQFIEEIVGLTERFKGLYDDVYRYLYTEDSRLEWVVNKDDLMTSRVTGIPGIDKVGFNEYQRMWVAFNKSEDAITQSNANMSYAMFLASAFSPNEVKRIRSQLESERNHELERRRRIVEGLPLDAQIAEGHKTVEQLQKEMDNAISGEKDWHDMVIEGYEESVRKRVKEQIAKDISMQEQMQNMGSGFIESVYESSSDMKGPATRHLEYAAGTDKEIQDSMDKRMVQHLGDRRGSYEGLIREEALKRQGGSGKKGSPGRAGFIDGFL